MELTVINSNSAGNGYILQNEREALIIECGVAFSLIKQHLNFNLKKVVGCLITHEHGDHAKSIQDAIAAGINVYASAGTLLALGANKSHRCIETFSGDHFTLGGFKIYPFDIQHDVAEPLGFVIHHEETGKILFLTDSFYCKYTFSGLNQIIIEANYCKSILKSRGITGESPQFLNDRVLRSHMSIQTCREMLAANDLSQVQKIVLIHLSDGNSDEVRFKSEIEQQTGKMVFIATPGLTIPFNKQPF